MKYKVGDKVWVWRSIIREEPKEVIISAYSGKASFNEDVYEFEYYENGRRLYQSGAGESDLYETLEAAQYARFKIVRTIEDIFEQIEDIVTNNKKTLAELKHELNKKYNRQVE